MRAAFALLFLFFSATPAPPPARDPGRVVLAADAETRWVPFELTAGNQIRFAAEVDGRPATAMLDTGVSLSILSRGFAGLDPDKVLPAGRAAAVGGSVELGWTPTRSLRIGALTRAGGTLGVADMPESASGTANPVDLLVGRDLLDRFALDIDYPGKRFRLLPSGRLPFTGATAPLAVSPERRVYETELVLGGRRLRPVIVDTGDGSPVTLSRESWLAARPAGVTVTSAVSYGLAGAVVTGLAVAPDLRLGGLPPREVEVRVEPPRAFSHALGVAGRIGSGFLGRYRVLLDPGAGRMVLEPGPEADAAPPRSTSGLLVSVRPDRLRVLHVMRGGPAAAAGWRPDETICAVDGAAITPDYVRNPIAAWTVGEPGRVVRLTTCAGVERPLTLRRFY